MFDTVLIANRGAIATRILRTLHRLGARGVAVYAEADYASLHVARADQAHSLGDGPAARTYLDSQRILEIARASGAQAIHPGYGFLSENAGFAEACEAAGIAFVGPTPTQMRAFGLKHTARALACAAGLPLLQGTGLLASVDDALTAAATVGYPVMLKSTAGGGGIGMRVCRNAAELSAQYDAVRRLGQNNFHDSGVFLEKYIERARHIEVQIFGDGRGEVIALGERDCSVQRRNQKVIEETPAPSLSTGQRNQLHEAAVRLARAVNYRNAGTVEFVYDADAQQFYFLEVNTRLQVEHGVTEQVWGVDLVEWMLRLAAGTLPPLSGLAAGLAPQGHAVQARLYAEDPGRDFQPCPGLLTHAEFPPADGQALRIDTWVEPGVEVPPDFDPMIAKLISWAPDRAQAFAGLEAALSRTLLYGVETNLGYLRQILGYAPLLEGLPWTRCLEGLPYHARSLEVLAPGTQTSVQDLPGRLGYWAVGIPPSGPMDAKSFAQANALLGNAHGAAGLEVTLAGPTLRFNADAVVALTGAALPAQLDGAPMPMNRAVRIAAGSTLALGRIAGAGVRAYLAVRGGLDVPDYLGSQSTFTLGRFGGHAGRQLAAGDILRLNPCADLGEGASLPPAEVLTLDAVRELRVMIGPHAAPDYLTPVYLQRFLGAEWEVHFNSSRTGVRLIGPKPEWAREDGGEAGLHPSNLHDNAYAVGAVDFTGDMPVILGPDGPSLGGFVCPAVVIHEDLCKLGQLKAGDRLRFVAVGDPNPVLADQGSGAQRLCARRAGDRYLLLEFGEPQIDLATRFRVDALMSRLEALQLPGVIDLTPGIRSLQLHFDPALTDAAHLVHEASLLWAQLREAQDLTLPSRIVHLPLSWDDPATRLAIDKYNATVRPNAPWCPSNIEFIRRINGLGSVQQVQEIVFAARYLVLGLGDVYLGAPVATPLDPRHRLVTTKYNPARTWTPENAVGIGGAYLCVYGMEGPGGYQFVGRTLQMWNRYQPVDAFCGKPWLLRIFDQIQFHPVSAEELLRMRAAFPLGRYPIRIENTELSLADYQRFLGENQAEIERFKARQQAAFDAERAHWAATGQAQFEAEEAAAEGYDGHELSEDDIAVYCPVAGTLWKLEVEIGHEVQAGDLIAVLEAMKMEIQVVAPEAGRLRQLLARPGSALRAGSVLAVLERTLQP